MTGPHPATAAIRLTVRAVLGECDPGDLALVACSGGADSLALAAAVAFEASKLAVRAGAVVVDHGLDPRSAAVAERAGGQCSALGLAPVGTVRVEVDAGADGLESAARDARYAALTAAADLHGARLVLLGHTLDDQAEQVLLGLARGSGARSLAGMPRARGRFRRPLLGVTREQTRASCVAEGLTWWDDPMNDDPAFTRVRARRALVDLERDLGPGVAAALARTADQLREDADHLDALADAALSRFDVNSPEIPGGFTSNRPEGAGVWVAVDAMLALARPVRTRVWRRLVVAAGAPAGQVSTRHTEACDALLTDWHGQGPVSLPGPLQATRSDGRVSIGTPARVE
ncbi:tRNA lysidine(34) synthetase TilS [Phycicoccus sp. Soil802]|uniref:tRNA lysidine(34) synthetase TilS n=1 Tax=Phycicoccus sp. Soil802 TaxID=1736414 RepID=UPI0007024277|nr:tRNA lysidine(34) synthetase TilS [Phycicoccus sp. Soil802]KRF29220.1 tRNA(Ile)-lysidine synthetase [Phycicoccus sp. Soil802]